MQSTGPPKKGLQGAISTKRCIAAGPSRMAVVVDSAYAVHIVYNVNIVVSLSTLIYSRISLICASPVGVTFT